MIINYKELLYAIFNSNESSRKTNSVVCVYDVLDNERLVGVFSNSRACGTFFGTSRRVIDCNICRQTLKNNRYKLERVKLDERI